MRGTRRQKHGVKCKTLGEGLLRPMISAPRAKALLKNLHRSESPISVLLAETPEKSGLCIWAIFR